MHTERVWTIPVELTVGHEDDAADLLRSYYSSVGSDGGPAYTGAMFERLNGGGDRPEVADHFTADDLVAVSLLSVTVPGAAALRILGSRAAELDALLSAIPRDLDLADAGDDVIGTDSPAQHLWTAVRRERGLGEVTTASFSLANAHGCCQLSTPSSKGSSTTRRTRTSGPRCVTNSTPTARPFNRSSRQLETAPVSRPER